MAKSKHAKIEIIKKTDCPNATMGSNTEVRLNGKALKGVTSASFHVEAGGLAKVTLTMIGDLSVKGIFNKSQYQLGSYCPVSIAKNNKTKEKTKVVNNG